MASSDYLLEIEGIKGESTDDKHKGTIEIESFSWGVSQTGSSSSGGGAGAGRASFQDFSFVTPVSIASPPLFLACASGEHIKSATLFVRKAGGKQQEYLIIKMSDILVSSYQTGASEVVPTDSISMSFSKIDLDYKAQKSDGSLDSVGGGWDVIGNKQL